MAGWSLQDKVFFITGGGAGIGAATARELARRGAVPVLADVDPQALRATAATISPEPLTIELDVTDLAACQAAIAETVERHGRLDAVWANAGIASFGPLELEEPVAWQRTIDVNLTGAYNTVFAALPQVIAQRGYVAVTASLAAFAHAPGMSAYAATKAGVEAMCNSLRIEVAHQGVEVATIHPTWIATAMVTEGEDQLRAFKRLREAMTPPFKKSYPVEHAVRDIVRGFEARARRICTPSFVRFAHVLRAALTTRAFERDLLKAAPEISSLYAQEVAERGGIGAALSDRTQRQVPRDAGERVGA